MSKPRKRPIARGTAAFACVLGLAASVPASAQATARAAAAASPSEPGRLDDPTRPDGYGLEQAPLPAPLPYGAWRLSFLRTGPDGAVAIINDQTVRVGDRLGSAEVTAIREGAVILEESGRTVEIWFDGFTSAPRR